MKIKTTLLVAATAALFVSSAQAQTLFDISTIDDMSLSHSSGAPAASPPIAGSETLNLGVFSWGTLATDGSGNTASFTSGIFESADWGGTGTFTSIAIDVSTFDLIDIAGIYSGSFNTGTESSNFFYNLDGGGEVVFGIGVEDASATNVAAVVSSLDVSGASSLVVGFAFNHNGSSDSFDVGGLTVTVVPEPSAYALLAGMLALVSVMVRRRSMK